MKRWRLGTRIFLKNACAQRARAEHRGVNNPLLQLLAAESLAQRACHEMDEIEQPLPILRQLLVFLLNPVRLPACTRQPHEHHDDANKQARQDKPNHAGRF